MTLVTCETTAAISLHLRKLEPNEEPCYSGRKNPRATTLCGRPVGWDTRIDPTQATCNACRQALET
jgi:hypothetical protein